MDLDAKNPKAWRFGDILGYDHDDNGKDTGTLRIMFISPCPPIGNFTSLNLVGHNESRASVVVGRSYHWWVRIEKAGE